MSTDSARTTIQQLRKLLSQFGIPDTIVSDHGIQFTASEFQDFCQSNGIRHTAVASYLPLSNKLAERAVCKELRKIKDGNITVDFLGICFSTELNLILLLGLLQQSCCLDVD